MLIAHVDEGAATGVHPQDDDMLIAHVDEGAATAARDDAFGAAIPMDMLAQPARGLPSPVIHGAGAQPHGGLAPPRGGCVPMVVDSSTSDVDDEFLRTVDLGLVAPDRPTARREAAPIPPELQHGPPPPIATLLRDRLATGRQPGTSSFA